MSRKLIGLYLLLCGTASAQVFDDDVDGLKLTSLSKYYVRLSWDATPGVPCVYSVSYSVFRSAQSDFSPTGGNRVAEGVFSTEITLPDRSNSDSYYHVRAVKHPLSCSVKPEASSGGVQRIHPIASDNGGLLVSLRTKWRTVNDERGFLSYIIEGIYAGTGEASRYFSRLEHCSFSLDLLDSENSNLKSQKSNSTALREQAVNSSAWKRMISPS